MAVSFAQLRPMLATAGQMPSTEGLPHAFEYKWDGMRVLAHAKGKRLHLMSRNGLDATLRFPELAGLARDVPDDTVLDGEVVAMDAQGKPDFGALQTRMTVRDPDQASARAETTPVQLMVFDVLKAGGKWMMAYGYEVRRTRLESMGIAGTAWRTPPSHTGVGEAMLELSRGAGLEGIVAKRLGSPYEPGARSPAWLKIRNKMRQEFVVGGWEEGTDHRAGDLRSLLLGYFEDGELVYVGRVGTGFKARDWPTLQRALRSHRAAASPFAFTPPESGNVHWLVPGVVCEVEFGATTASGTLRHASFKGLRFDKPAQEVRWEQAGDVAA